MNTVIMIYPDGTRERFEDIQEQIEDLENLGLATESIPTTDRLLKKLTKSEKGTYHSIIANIDVRPSSKVQPREWEALNLEKAIRNNKFTIPMAIVVPKNTFEIQKSVDQAYTWIIEDNEDLDKNLIEFLKGHEPPAKGIEIILNFDTGPDDPQWHYKIQYKNIIPDRFDKIEGGVAKPTRTDIEILKRVSGYLDKKLDIEENLKTLGQHIGTLLYSSGKGPAFDRHDQESSDKRDSDFCNSVRQALKHLQDGSFEQIHLRFVLGEEIYPIFLESINTPLFLNASRSEEANNLDRLWMMRSPVIRHVNLDDKDYRPFFEEDSYRPINVLILGADTSGVLELNDKDGRSVEKVSLDQLSNIRTECEELEGFFKGLKKQIPKIGEIRTIISDEANSMDFYKIEKIIKSLAPDNRSHWDIIHYAGHSHYSSHFPTGAGFLFFHDEYGLTRPVQVNRFLMHAIGTRLLYLSSCSSAEKHFIYEAANNQVSHVIGFRSEIEDATAMQFTKDFYKSMFELESVENAFYEVRKNLYDQDKIACDDNSSQAPAYDWLKPVLVLDGYRG